MAKKLATFINGRRKTSVVRIRMLSGKGEIICNGKPYQEYFKRKSVCASVQKPFDIINQTNKFKVIANLKGGGLSSQSGALRLAIAKNLKVLFPDDKVILKKNGFLTRDSRKVQRKLYGHKKARKSFQFSKR